MWQLVWYFFLQVFKDIMPNKEAWFPWSATVESLSNFFYWHLWAKWWTPIQRWNVVNDHVRMFVRPSLSPTASGAVIILPGMNGDHTSHYVQQFVYHVALKKNLDVYVILKKECDLGQHANPESIRLGLSELHAKGYFKDNAEGFKLGLVGFSAGALSVVQYLSLYDGIDYGLTIGAGFNLANISKHLSNCWSRALYWCIYKKYDMTLHQADELKAKTLGYKCVDDFYTANSCDDVLMDIKVPLYVLAAQDDPVIDPKNWPHLYASAAKNLNIRPFITRYGGHLGWAGAKWLYETLLQEVFA